MDCPDGKTLAFGVRLSVMARGPSRDKEHVSQAAFGSPVSYCLGTAAVRPLRAPGSVARRL